MRKEPANRFVSIGWISAVAIGGITLAAAALAQSPFDTALVFDPLTVIQAARPPRGSSFKDLVIGQATRPMVAAALGQPTGGTGNVVEWKDTADCRRFDLEGITARFDRNDVLEQLWIRLRRPLHPGTVVAAFSLNQPSEIRPNGAQEVQMFTPAGIAMGVRGGWVDALWLIQARPAPAHATTAAPPPPPTEVTPAPGIWSGSAIPPGPTSPPPEIPPFNWPVAGQEVLPPNAPPAAAEDEAGPVKAVALEFLAAANRGDVAALRRVATDDLARRLEEDLEGQTQEDRAERQVRKLTCDGDRARAEVWMKNPAVQNLYAELMASVELQRSPGGWQVSRFSVKPYLRDLDEEVRP